MKEESREDIFDTQCWMTNIIVDPIEGAYRPQTAQILFERLPDER